MFLQVIRGEVFEATAIRSFDDRWIAELSLGADGYLGSTEGVTADGTFVGWSGSSQPTRPAATATGRNRAPGGPRPSSASAVG